MPTSEQLQTIENLFQQGNKKEAQTKYETLMQDALEQYDLWVNYAFFLYRYGQYDEAITIAKKSLDIETSAEGFHNLGSCFAKTGKTEKAIEAYKKAVETNTDFVQSHNDLAALYEKIGKLDCAIDHYQIATTLSPKSSIYWCNLAHARQSSGRFREALTALRFAYALNDTQNDHLVLTFYANLFKETQDFEINKQLANEVRDCLDDPLIDNKNLVQISLKHCLHQALVIGLSPDGHTTDYAPTDFHKALEDKTVDWQELNNPDFTSILCTFPVREYIFETRLTALRKHCLKRLNDNNKGETLWGDPLLFLNALACQCFINEYVFTETDEEKNIISRLEEKIINAQDLTLYDIAIYACYRPLHKLPRAQDMPKKLETLNILTNMVKVQLEEPLQEEIIKRNIKSLTTIDDDISKIVKEQYEENPYPRWTNTSRGKSMSFQGVTQYIFPYLEDERFSYINNKKTRTLIAGCGTGKQSIQTALTYQNSDILAIDLSASSIAYAESKTREYGIENVEYAIADILKIEELNEKFDVIQCGGVLHHMREPLEGWKALYNVLKPGGFMLIALYSEIARRPVVATREFIEEHQYNASVESIRKCREDIQNLPDGHPAKPVTSRVDFFTTSTCRDLIFHVQEHRFSTREIKKIIDSLSLEFLGFNLQFTGTNTLAKYAALFPNDPHGLNLENWHIFEHSHPDTFKGMYQLWLQKPYS